MNKTSEGLLGTLLVTLLIVGASYFNPMLLGGFVFVVLFLYFSYGVMKKANPKTKGTIIKFKTK